MAPYESGDTPAGRPTGPEPAEGIESTQPRPSRRAVRYVVPFAVVGVAAAGIGLVPALASSGDPSLPKVTAEQLMAKIAASGTHQLSGTVKMTSDLGLPNLGGAAAFVGGGARGGQGAAPSGAPGSAGSSADPQSKLPELATGTHTLRVAVDGPDRHKVSVLENASEYSLIHNGDDVWAYDSASNEAYHAKAHAKAGTGDTDGTGAPGVPGEGDAGKLPGGVPATPDELARQALSSVDDTTSVTVDGTEHVAGRDAYTLLVKPKQDDTTVGAITVAVDAQKGVPLKFTLTPASGGSAVFEVGYTQVDFGKPAASTFDFTPPKGAKVTEADQMRQQRQQAQGKDRNGDMGGPNGMRTVGKGWDAIGEFTLPGGKGIPSGSSADMPPGARKFLDSLGESAHGTFGSGTVFSPRLINALVTENGKVYVGAVTKDALVKAANAAQ